MSRRSAELCAAPPRTWRARREGAGTGRWGLWKDALSRLQQPQRARDPAGTRRRSRVRGAVQWEKE